MDLKATLAKLDDLLAPEAETQDMTEAQFETYVKEQLEKAKADKEDEKKDAKKKGKAKKRLEHLKSTIEVVAKGVWDGDNATQAIPIYNEPNLTADSELTEKEIPPQNMNSMDSGASWAGAGGASDFAKAIDDIGKALDDAEGKKKKDAKKSEEETKTEGGEANFAWPSDLADADFQKEGIAKSVTPWGKDTESAPSK